MTDPVTVTVKDRVLEVALSAPPDNRMTYPMLDGLNSALDRFEQDDALHLFLLQGNSTCFSKGFDLSTLSSRPTADELNMSLVLSNALFTRLARCPKPTVAAICGACLGGGLELALCCHFRLCNDRARIGLPEIWIKLVPGLGGTTRLCKLIGPAKALELVALGDLVSPEEALRLNLVNRVFPKAEFAERVDGFIKALLLADSVALREAIRIVNSYAETPEDDNLRMGWEAFAKLALSWSPPKTF